MRSRYVGFAIMMLGLTQSCMSNTNSVVEQLGYGVACEVISSDTTLLVQDSTTRIARVTFVFDVTVTGDSDIYIESVVSGPFTYGQRGFADTGNFVWGYDVSGIRPHIISSHVYSPAMSSAKLDVSEYWTIPTGHTVRFVLSMIIKAESESGIVRIRLLGIGYDTTKHGHQFLPIAADSDSVLL